MSHPFAVMSTPAYGVWTVLIQPDPGRDRHAHIHVSIPCSSYEHAQAVAGAYNHGWAPKEERT